jgi:4-alpha-glucanotransferase
MSDQTTRASPFPPGNRASGVLLHVTSLPSPYGIGDLGPTARTWIDRLQEAGQSWWQALPLGPTGYGNSPYQPLSSFAGNWLVISPEELTAEGLLCAGDVARQSFFSDSVDYDAVITSKHHMLETIWSGFRARASAELKSEFERFCAEQAHWLDDYALFRALKARHKGAPYLQWPAELVHRSPAALAQARRDLADPINQSRLAQFLLFRQGERLKQHARSRGIRLIGDLPFFVSPDSSDVWANPDLFLLDGRCRPHFVAGVPPDYFSAQGQLWGNPVYDWEAHRRTDYRWYTDRVRALLAHVDVIRLDHFRGFASAWHVPAGAASARTGEWVPGPGADLFDALARQLGTLPFIAEDLGIITPDVRDLRDRFGVPGTRVLQFAFDGNPDNPHLPHNYVPNTVVYTGTHDNNTTRGWFEELPENQRRNFREYARQCGQGDGDTSAVLLGLAWSSVAALALAPLQDLLDLGSEARMNVPGRAEGNWHWRATQDMLAPPKLDSLRRLTETTKRLPAERYSALSDRPSILHP